MTDTESLLTALNELVSRRDFTVPPYPAVALSLQKLLGEESYGVGDVERVVSADAALAISVLAAANSAAHGGKTPVTSLRHAIGQLGARTVGAIAFAIGLVPTATSSGALLDVKFRAWQRTMICALACQKLSTRRGIPPEQAFLAGLLHGFGRSIAIASIEDLLSAHPPAQPLSLSEWLSVVEQGRARLARALAESWRLPPDIVAAVDAGPRGSSALNDLVLDADHLASELSSGGGAENTGLQGRTLEELLVSLPALLEPFLAGGGTVLRQRVVPSPFVSKPEHVIGGELRAASLQIVDRGTKAPVRLESLSIAADGLELKSTRPYQESAIVRLAICADETRLEPWFTVVLCVPLSDVYRVELKLFSPTRDVRALWNSCYEAAEASGPSDAKSGAFSTQAAQPFGVPGSLKRAAR